MTADKPSQEDLRNAQWLLVLAGFCNFGIWVDSKRIRVIYVLYKLNILILAKIWTNWFF